MKIKLKYWETLLLFLPCIAGMVLMEISAPNRYLQQSYFAIANLLLQLSYALLVGYQTYLLVSFTKVIGSKSLPVILNACIPLVFSIVYLLNVSYFTLVHPT